jgi:hypothetical protein
MRKMDRCECERPSPQKRRLTKDWAVLRALVALGALPVVICVTATCAGVSAQEKQNEPLGSLSSTGEVYVNGSPAPAESTIFAGDALRTGETGAATFTMSGKGDLKVSRQSQVVFSDGSQYAAELKRGTVVLDSSSGPGGVTLLAGGYVVVPAVREQVTSARIDGTTSASFQVLSLTGAVAIVALRGNSGQLLQLGQSVNLSPQGLLAPHTPSVAKSHTRWVLLGLAGAGAAAAAGTVAVGHGGATQPVSPSAP